jgi:hypothetical protein
MARSLAEIQENIDTMKESIRLAWIDLDGFPPGSLDRAHMREGIQSQVDDLQILLQERDSANA